MAQQPENENQAKGFSGLDSMVSDVSKDVEQAKSTAQSSQSQSEPATVQVSGKAATGPATSRPIEKGAGASSGSSGIKWVLGLAAIILVVWLIGYSNKQESPSYSPPLVTAPSPAPRPRGETEVKPPVGDAHVLNREQIRYCLSEEIRLSAIETIVNASQKLEVDKFNSLVADYNGRCGHFGYRRGSLESVRAEVETRRSEIERIAQTDWLGESAGTSISPKIDRVPKDRETKQKHPVPNNRQKAESLSSSGPGVSQKSNSLANFEEGEKETAPSTLDLSGLNNTERSSIESACSNDRILHGPAAYNKCLILQFSKLRVKR